MITYKVGQLEANKKVSGHSMHVVETVSLLELVLKVTSVKVFLQREHVVKLGNRWSTQLSLEASLNVSWKELLSHEHQSAWSTWPLTSSALHLKHAH